MPMLLIRTNRDLTSDDRRDLLRSASALCAQALGKSEDYVMTTLECDRPMTFAGSDAPCAYLELKSLGLTAEQTPALSQTLCHFVEEKLGIPQERVYIEFSAPERPFWGWNGRTF